MTGFAFALVALFGVPAAIVALILLAHRLVPAAIWYSRPVQALSVLAFLSCIGLPIAIINADSQGDYFEDHIALVSEAFALPQGVTIDHQRDKTLRLGDCWRNAVNWRSDVAFGSPSAFDQWYADEGWRSGVVQQVAGYFGEELARIDVAPGALDLRMRDPKYQLSRGRDSHRQNARIAEFYEPFVCTAIEKDANGRVMLRPCDPIALTEDIGNAGRIIIKPKASKRWLEGRIYYAQGPSTCTNPVRRAVNNALGLPHPEGGEPNTSMGAVLPIM
ncbi:MAG TPA: hypothetical protein VLA50_03000 [Erythrobacter sp.]|nr:hypothetical protein [Erythrobacter sp.]